MQNQPYYIHSRPRTTKALITTAVCVAAINMPAISTASPVAFHPLFEKAQQATSSKGSFRTLEPFLNSDLEKRLQLKRNYQAKLSEVKRIQLSGGIDSLPEQTLSILIDKGIDSLYINSTEDNSIAFEFKYNKTYHLIEFFEDGDIVLLKGRGESTEAWDAVEDDYFNMFEEHFFAIHE